MNKFEIIADSSHDLAEEFLVDKGIRTVAFYIRLGDDNFLQDQVDISREELYAYLRENKKVYPKTSLPSVEDYISSFREVLEEGRDLICLTVASSLSGSYQSAHVAGQMMREDYPDRRIYILDSKSASLGVGLLIERAVELREQGWDLVDVRDELEAQSQTTEIYIYLETLAYLEEGGRISRPGALAGKLLKIKPLASFKNNKLAMEGAVRGSKKALAACLDYLHEKIKDAPDDYHIFVIHGNVEDLALETKAKIEERYGLDLAHDVALVSAAVISHIGPGAIGIGCMKK